MGPGGILQFQGPQERVINLQLQIFPQSVGVAQPGARLVGVGARPQGHPLLGQPPLDADVGGQFPVAGDDVQGQAPSAPPVPQTEGRLGGQAHLVADADVRLVERPQGHPHGT